MNISSIIITRAIKKGTKLPDHIKYRITAIGYSKKWEYVGMSTNKPGMKPRGDTSHAEASLMLRYGKNIKYVILLRVNKNGDFLPIDPCANCSRLAKLLNIKILSLNGEMLNDY